MITHRPFFETCYALAVQAAESAHVLPQMMPKPPKGELVVVGAGKGAAQLAAVFEQHYPHNVSGVVVTRYGCGVPCEKIRVIEAAHPVPDQNSLHAAEVLLQEVSGLSEDDLVVALVTGGGSALLALPLAPITMDDEVLLNQALLASGAPIGQMNIVRRHLSAIKGGRLAKAAEPARVISYIVSDVPGDDPAEVASGPTVSGNTRPEDAEAVIHKYGLDVPERVHQALRTPDAVCPRVASNVHLVASAGKSLAVVIEYAQRQGLAVLNLGDRIEGEAQEVARDHAKIVQAKIAAGWQGLIISGGETTVTLKNAGNIVGRGGRNGEYLLSLAVALQGVAGVSMFAADTDGIDGSEENAGAFADQETVAHMRKVGIDAEDFLARHDSYSAFAAVDALFSPGASGTNINDLRLILIGDK